MRHNNLKVNQNRISSIFQAKMLNISWFQLLICMNLLFFFVIYDRELRVLALDGWLDKESYLKTSVWALGHCEEQLQKYGQIWKNNQSWKSSDYDENSC